MEPALLALASKSGGDLRKLLYAFFSFLNRRTDFYLIPNAKDVEEGIPARMGFKEGDAEKLLLAAFRQFPLRRIPRQASSSSTIKTTSPKTTPTQTVPNDGKKPTYTSKAHENQNELSNPMSQTRIDDNEPKPKPSMTVRTTEEGKQIPVGNGGTTERYQWTQTLEEVSVIAKVPFGTRGKDLAVTIKPSFVSICLKKKKEDMSSSTILDGKLFDTIRTDESTWSLEGQALLLTLDKCKHSWWETVIQGDDIIDVTKVDSTRKIGSYDEATQGYIRKILFDQHQERLGKPTSDEILMTEASKISGVEIIDKKKMNQIQKQGSGKKITH